MLINRGFTAHGTENMNFFWFGSFFYVAFFRCILVLCLQFNSSVQLQFFIYFNGLWITGVTVTLSSLAGSPVFFFSKSGLHDFQFVFCGFYLVIYFPSFFFLVRKWERENGRLRGGGNCRASISQWTCNKRVNKNIFVCWSWFIVNATLWQACYFQHFLFCHLQVLREIKSNSTFGWGFCSYNITRITWLDLKVIPAHKE